MADEPDNKEETTEDGARVLKVKAFTKDESKDDESADKPSEKKDEKEVKVEEPKAVTSEAAAKPKEEDKTLETKPEGGKVDAKAPATVSSFSQLDQERKPASTQSSSEVKEEPKKEEVIVADKPDDVEKHKVSSDEVKKWLSDSHSEESKDIEKKRGINFKALFLVFLILALIAVIVGGVYYYRSRVPGVTESESEVVVKRVDEVTPTETATPTPEEELDVNEYTLQILNGSGIPGEAGIVETLLSDIEFSDVTTANADAYDYTDTEVAIKEDVPEAVYGLIEGALEGSYTVVLSEDVLDEDGEYSVIVIVGEKK